MELLSDQCSLVAIVGAKFSKASRLLRVELQLPSCLRDGRDRPSARTLAEGANDEEDIEYQRERQQR
jgi:hypothetical protein